MSSLHENPLVSVVVIGRNEGPRLTRCLSSIRSADWNGIRYEVVYVDSQSSDGSLVAAANVGARCIQLEGPSVCAAKARNLGWMATHGSFILFLDGDTELAPGFVKTAMAALEDRRVCAAWGHRRESHPEQSIYNRVLDLDWVYPVGRTLYFGGDVLIRRSALGQVGGFDPSLKAGEEPELCARLRSLGWEIEHIDAPMTRHDLAITSFAAYAKRCFRGGVAYAEISNMTREAGTPLWQRDAARNFWHGMIYSIAALLFVFMLVVEPVVAAGLLLMGAAIVARTAWRSRWKTGGQAGLGLLYAIHSHVQKIPAFFGQLAWRMAHRQHRELNAIEYKERKTLGTRGIKTLLASVLTPVARLQRTIGDRWERFWSFSRLQEALGKPIDSSVVVLGRVELHGTRNISLGRNILLYPGVYLETQGQGRIEIGDGVVLSRGVHIVAYDRVVLDADCMVGEYSSIRDANHRASDASMRNSGHDSAEIRLGKNVWIGRGVTVLKGTSIGSHSIVGANAVVNRSLGERSRAAGIPAKHLHAAYLASY